MDICAPYFSKTVAANIKNSENYSRKFIADFQSPNPDCIFMIVVIKNSDRSDLFYFRYFFSLFSLDTKFPIYFSPHNILPFLQPPIFSNSQSFPDLFIRDIKHSYTISNFLGNCSRPLSTYDYLFF